MWCRKCFKEQETVDHILSQCKNRRKEMIKRHDEVGKEIYLALGKKYKLFEHYIDEPGVIKTEKLELIWNKKTLITFENAKIKKNQPDITIIDKEKQQIITFDVSIVKRENLEEAYMKKIQNYEEPTRLTKDLKNLSYSETIPIIITVEGIIHKKSAESLEKIGLKIRWEKVLYKLLIFNVNMIQKSYNENWEYRGRLREMHYHK